ncbi:hypothetical protein C4559_03125 [Candidatus Microgenomates bacterium]|nr:MAG: hypothetical protein C4559_03125 [Candidatus Microgenomates bacterium]
MKSIDVLYYSLSIGFLVLVIFISYTVYRFSTLLQSLKGLIEKTSISTFGGIFESLLKIISIFLKKGGGKNDE